MGPPGPRSGGAAALAALLAAMLCLAAAAPASAAGPPTILRARASRVTASSATLHIAIATGELATSYEVILVDPCPEPIECIIDLPVAEGTLPASNRTRHLTIPIANQQTAPWVEPDTTYEYWVYAENSAGEAETRRSSFKTKP